MFCKRMAIIHRKGRDRLEELREEHRAESERLLEVFGDVLAAAREASPSRGRRGGAAATRRGGRCDVTPPEVSGAPAGSRGRGPDGAGEDVAARTGQVVLKALEARRRPGAAGGRAPGGGGLPREQLPAAAGGVLPLPPGGAVHAGRRASSWRRPAPSAGCWTRWSSSAPCGTGAGSGSGRPASSRAVTSRSGSQSTSTPSPRRCGSGRCATGAGPGCWRGVTWRCACSPTWPPNCDPGTSPWSARTPTPTCTTR